MMDENIDNIIIEHLRALRSDVAGLRTNMQAEFSEVKNRLSSLEAGHGMVMQHISHLANSIAGQQVSLDRVNSRLDRIEHRLDLADAE